MLEAVDSIILVKIDEFILGEAIHDRAVLVEPPQPEVGYEELDFPIELVGGEEEGNQHISEVMEEVSSVSCDREDDCRDSVINGALRGSFITV